jgi:hypothetical protein
MRKKNVIKEEEKTYYKGLVRATSCRERNSIFILMVVNKIISIH